MNRLTISKTKQTPEINFDPESGILDISGRSIPENTYEFYTPVMEWLESYASNPQNSTVFKVYFEYLNTSSSKYLFEIFRILEKIYRNGKMVKVKWFYEEDVEEMMESGEDYAEMIKIPFEIKVLEENTD